MLRVIINGSKGRMGQALAACAARRPDLQVTGQADLGDDLTPLFPKADVLVDFSFHTVTPTLAEACVRHGKALVTGTTGFSDQEISRINQCSAHIPIVLASNFSTGVNTLFWLTEKAVDILGPDFDVEIVEMHHRLKKDAPSGTAATLAEILARKRKQKLAEVARHGRHGITGERSSEEIGLHSLRGGDVVGDHTVIFAANGERIELSHKASSRDTFASGALRAATWIVGRKPGLYSMQDVLGLR